MSAALAFRTAVVHSSDMQSAPERDAAGPSAESFEGVPLMQLAAVAAARAEGFPMEEVLAAEGLELAAYRRADVAYKIRLADPAHRERLVADYEKELERAEDRLTRKVSPIDEDVDAWVRFLASYAAQSTPADWIAALGLSLPDLSRLSRMWRRRFESDETLERRAEDASRDKKPYDVSSLRVAAPKLVASPAARAREKLASANVAPENARKSVPVRRFVPKVEPLPEAPATPIAPAIAAQSTLPPIPAKRTSPPQDKPPKPVISLEQHAALTVEIATYPAHAMAILSRYGMTPPQKVELDQHYERIVSTDPAKQAAWHAAYGAHYATLMRTPRR